MVNKIEFKTTNKNSGFEIVSLDIFFQSINPRFIKKQYRSNFYNLIYVTEGRSSHEIDFVEYTVNAGEALVISNNRVHKYCDYENVKGYIIMFTEGFMCEFLSKDSSEAKNLFKRSLLNPHITTIDLYSSIISNLFQSILSMYKISNQVITNKVIASTLNSIIQIIVNSGNMDSTLAAQKNEMFLQFTELLEKNIDHEKTVEGYAKMMHVSEKTVNQITRKAVDKSAKQYIINQLIQRIKFKLSFEQNSINEISDHLGFSEASNMSRFFKRHAGISPKEFRNKIKVDKLDLFSSENQNFDLIKNSIEEKIYHISSDIVVPLHKHSGHDEIFYCIKGSGFGVMADKEVELKVGMTFIARAGEIHALRTNEELYVISFLVPIIENRDKL
ncbi:MAG: helix-turn-helix domain-containing protein [Firmicutes bacterium]|jgi:AraC-like DNA-binding protein|nr:helix-turn-helix domain-containing protein [Bacillota bacterium]